jgi:hypothetical protein
MLRIEGSGDLTFSGNFLGPAADFNGDGLADFVVGAADDLHPADPLRFHVVFGARDLEGSLSLGSLRGRGVLLRGAEREVLPPNGAQGTGDLNGDGIADFAFSEMGADWIVLTGENEQEVHRSESPGAVYVVFGTGAEARFIRGDSNFDVLVNLADAVNTLGFLFMGGLEPLCEDALDTDDNGILEITDAVRLLNFLFLGAAAPPPPFPEAGVDPTAKDALGCVGF